MYLQNNNRKYKQIQKEIDKILITSENIQQIVCNDEIKNVLSIEESKLLAKIVILYIDMQYIFEKKCILRVGLMLIFTLKS